MLFKRRSKALSGRNFKFMRNYPIISILLLLIFALIPYVSTNWDPYEIIGVRRDANLDQIKKAYREMAKKLHPDKSNLNEEEAGRKFIELNKAFSILKDPHRKSRFDLHGDTEEARRHHGSRHHSRQTRDWTHNGPFTFFTSSNKHLRHKSITSKQYYKDFMRDSKHKLFFIFFYTDFCPSCSLIESAWTEITDKLENYNIGSFTINVHHESRLSQELGINSIPHIACLIDGQIKPYHQSELSLANIVKFARSILPNNLVTLLRTEDEQDRFITLGPHQNRLSAIIIHNENNLKLRYLLMAYELRFHYRLSHVSTKLSSYSLLAKQYNVAIDLSSRQTHLLVFDENITRPMINVNFNSDNFDIVQLKKQLLKWPFLQLPRLSSQRKFDDLCLYAIPRDGDKTNTRLCVILFTPEAPSTLPARNKFIEFIESNKLARDNKVVFTFMDSSRQSEFVSSILSETEGTYPFKTTDTIDSAIIIVERNPQDSRKAVHKWVSAKWDPSHPDELDKAKLELYQLVIDYKKNIHVLTNKVVLSLLVDEESPNVIFRVFWRFIDYTMRMTYYITSRESFSVIIILTFCALITSLFLYQSPPISQVNREPYKDTSNERPIPNCLIPDDDFRIIELKAETYNGVIRLLKPGYRSIILLSDQATRDKLIPQFKRAVWPYRRNKTLLFGYLCLDKNLDWYKSLLQQVIGARDLRVNRKNCIGTVLSLNGFRKYFRVYHAKHHEIYCFEDEFNDDENDSVRRSEPEVLFEMTEALCTDNLLDGLSIWLDKMFDGMTKRYFLNEWPDEIN